MAGNSHYATWVAASADTQQMFELMLVVISAAIDQKALSREQLIDYLLQVLAGKSEDERAEPEAMWVQLLLDRLEQLQGFQLARHAPKL